MVTQFLCLSHSPFYRIFVLVVTLQSLVLRGRAAVESSKKLLAEALEKHEIVPQIIPAAPPDICEVEWGNEVINLGNNLTEAQIEEPPSVIKWKSKKDALYTLIMFGPDVPTRENPCEMMWRHWSVGNIPNNDVSKGDTIVEYENIEPFYRAGFHRILFLIYQQNGTEKLDFTKSRYIKKGAKWEVRGVWYFDKFLEKYNLTTLEAVNFFYIYDLNPHPDIPQPSVHPRFPVG